MGGRGSSRSAAPGETECCLVQRPALPSRQCEARSPPPWVEWEITLKRRSLLKNNALQVSECVCIAFFLNSDTS
eukprot:COSAG03_NODE_25612_length_264_cov_0.939394_1_plen_73_part_01